VVDGLKELGKALEVLVEQVKHRHVEAAWAHARGGKGGEERERGAVGRGEGGKIPIDKLVTAADLTQSCEKEAKWCAIR